MATYSVAPHLNGRNPNGPNLPSIKRIEPATSVELAGSGVTSVFPNGRDTGGSDKHGPNWLNGFLFWLRRKDKGAHLALLPRDTCCMNLVVQHSIQGGFLSTRMESRQRVCTAYERKRAAQIARIGGHWKVGVCIMHAAFGGHCSFQRRTGFHCPLYMLQACWSVKGGIHSETLPVFACLEAR